MKNKNIILYNLIFPFWLMLIFPPILIPTAIGNFIVDSIVVLLAMKFLKVEDIFKNYKISIYKVWIFGFISDIIGGIFMILGYSINVSPESKYRDFVYKFTSNVFYNPFDNIFSFTYVVICMIISSIFIYVYNTKITLTETNLSNKQKKIVSLALAIITCPYLFLLPTAPFIK
ncbi:hypothetical protein [[Clostridium] colinum]|uniref:hypothetical protein n=1 Tax=[Clostridium] colinum TaxID=36835 RepID=UPI0020252BE4|nr:hypothetical protein [[Clostridium] colinum]